MNKKNFIFVLILLAIFRLVVAPIVWHPDLRNHMDWGIRFWDYGPKAFYSANVWSWTWPNQPPGTMYIFAGVRKLFEFVFNILWKINISVPAFPSGIITWAEDNLYPGFLKLPAIIGDFGIAYLIYKIVQSIDNSTDCKKHARFASILWLFNPVVWYNSAVWGQYDSVINFFVLLSFYLLIKKKICLSLIAFSLSLYIKASLLVFMPVWLIIAFKQKYKISTYLKAVLCSSVIIVVLTVPFTKGNATLWLFKLFTDKIFSQQLHVITANAFNLWAGIAGIHERPDILPFLGLNFKLWSYIIYSTFYIPALVIVYKKQNTKTIIWVLTYIAFATFSLLTNMHERYLYPFFPYLTVLLATSNFSGLFYWVISTIGLLNLYNFWFVPKIPFIILFLSFGDRLMPRLLGFFSFGLFMVFSLWFLRQSRQTKV